MTLSERLKVAREKAGLTQAQLARALGISQPSVHDLESGRTKDFRGSTLLKLAKVLRQSPQWLANGEGELLPVPPLEVKSPDEDELLTSYRKLSAVERKVVLRMVRALVIDK